jgi:glycosidase
MAPNTPSSIRNLVIYEIYVRSHGPNGSFTDVEADLARIRDLGVDLVWFMPIHPIGQFKRKGSRGSPYAIVDYRAVNPEYGTLEDFRRLVASAHALGLKVMIDVVYNHTAADSRLVKEHPEWFHRDESGRPATTVPEWSDVIDLAHPDPQLAAYLIETLKGWAEFGVDGFRCDVASLVPLDFWLDARQAVDRVKPGVIWLAESVHTGWLPQRRAAGLRAHSDAELYQAFDLTYDYDAWPVWQAAVRGDAPLTRYLEFLRLQDGIYPANYAKLRCVENHDQPRILSLAPSRAQALAWTAFAAFNQGAFLLYAGQEAGATHTPSLFEVDPIDWNGEDLGPFLRRLTGLKKDPAQVEGRFVLLEAEPAIQAAWLHSGRSLYGMFNPAASAGEVPVQLPDGDYEDLLGGAPLVVRQGRANLPESAAILRLPPGKQPTTGYPLPSLLLDYRLPPIQP